MSAENMILLSLSWYDLIILFVSYLRQYISLGKGQCFYFLFFGLSTSPQTLVIARCRLEKLKIPHICYVKLWVKLLYNLTSNSLTLWICYWCRWVITFRSRQWFYSEVGNANSSYIIWKLTLYKLHFLERVHFISIEKGDTSL